MGRDYITIDECNMADPSLQKIPRVHLIGLNFKIPTIEKVEYVFKTFPTTNRFVIQDNIRFYNDLLKKTNKKYYVMNEDGDGIFSFFKKNNKVILNVMRLSPLEKAFVMSVALEDVLKNLEVIIMPEKYYREYNTILNQWTGNLVLTRSN